MVEIYDEDKVRATVQNLEELEGHLIWVGTRDYRDSGSSIITCLVFTQRVYKIVAILP